MPFCYSLLLLRRLKMPRVWSGMTFFNTTISSFVSSFEVTFIWSFWYHGATAANYEQSSFQIIRYLSPIYIFEESIWTWIQKARDPNKIQIPYFGALSSARNAVTLLNLFLKFYSSLPVPTPFQLYNFYPFQSHN